jgi:uncharacterized membrane protein
VNKDRFEAFSDSVFAFAVTLLVLGIALPAFAHPPPSEAVLTAALLSLWPSLLAYVLSFAVIGIMWQNHHALFRIVGRIDRMTSFLNLGLLGVTVFIPFTTSTLGAYPASRPATFLYGLTLTSSALMYNLLLAHLASKRSFHPNVSDATIRQTVIAYRLGMSTYFVATLISLIAPIVSFALYLLVAAYYLIPHGADDDLEAGLGGAL